jgi:hypothetical protein
MSNYRRLPVTRAMKRSICFLCCINTDVIIVVERLLLLLCIVLMPFQLSFSCSQRQRANEQAEKKVKERINDRFIAFEHGKNMLKKDEKTGERERERESQNLLSYIASR